MFIGFAILAGLLTMLPGLDTVQVLRAATVKGRAAAYRTVFGIMAGVLAMGVAAASGVSAIILASETGYKVLKIVGGAYLLYLGVKMLLEARRIGTESQVIDKSQDNATNTQAFMRAFIITFTNPKGLAFYIAVMPQFLPETMNPILGGVILTTIHNVEVLIWFSLVIWSTSLVRNYLEKPAAKKLMERISATAILAFGIKFLLD